VVVDEGDDVEAGCAQGGDGFQWCAEVVGGRGGRGGKGRRGRRGGKGRGGRKGRRGRRGGRGRKGGKGGQGRGGRKGRRERREGRGGCQGRFQVGEGQVGVGQPELDAGEGGLPIPVQRLRHATPEHHVADEGQDGSG